MSSNEVKWKVIVKRERSKSDLRSWNNSVSECVYVFLSEMKRTRTRKWFFGDNGIWSSISSLWRWVFDFDCDSIEIWMWQNVKRATMLRRSKCTFGTDWIWNRCIYSWGNTTFQISLRYCFSGNLNPNKKRKRKRERENPENWDVIQETKREEIFED